MADNEIVGEQTSKAQEFEDSIRLAERAGTTLGYGIALLHEIEAEKESYRLAIKDVLALITKGNYDGDLEAIYQAITNRMGGE